MYLLWGVGMLKKGEHPCRCQDAAPFSAGRLRLFAPNSDAARAIKPYSIDTERPNPLLA